MKTSKSYEENLEKLRAILAELSDENTPLDRAVSLYADAAKLIEACHKALQNAKVKIEEIDLSLQQEKTENDGV